MPLLKKHFQIARERIHEATCSHHCFPLNERHREKNEIIKVAILARRHNWMTRYDTVSIVHTALCTCYDVRDKSEWVK